MLPLDGICSIPNIGPGLAWMQVQSGNPQFDDLRLYQNWPRNVSTKVPSVISYSKTTTGRKQWGHDIDTDSVVMRWTKLELRPQQRINELEKLHDTLKGLGLVHSFQSEAQYDWIREAEEIIADFLKKVARKWFDDIHANSAAMLENVPIDLVVTHPGVS